MPLEDACQSYVGRALYAVPGEWTGWCRRRPDAPATEPGEYLPPPLPFHFRLVELERVGGALRGGVGVVVEPGHPEDAAWVGFVVRDGAGTSMHDFSANPANHNMGIGKSRPVISVDPDVAMPRWVRFEGAPHLSGIGYIADFEMPYQEFHKRLRK